MENKIALAKSIVSNHFTFYGGVMIAGNPTERNDIETMCTDGKNIFYSLPFVNTLSVIENATVLVHEIMHIVDKHHIRMGNRDPKLWNFACDLKVNNTIETYDYQRDRFFGMASFRKPDLRLQLPKGGLVEMPDLGLTRDKCRKMTAEEIYSVLEQNKDAVKDEPQQPWGGEIEKPTNEDGSEMNQEQLEKLSKSIDRKIVQAGIKAKQVGAINQEIQDVLNRVEESKVEWQEALTFHWQGGDNDSTYTYKKLNKKHLTWNAITPTIVGMSCGDIGVLQDTSASVDKKQRDRGFSEMNALSKDIKPDSITVIPFTSRVDVDGIKRFEQGEEIESLKINGTGGTKIRPAFQYIDENWQDFNFKKLVIFTDCEISDYGDEPQFDEPCDIIWICCQSKEKLGSYYLPPYGKTIFIDD